MVGLLSKKPTVFFVERLLNSLYFSNHELILMTSLKIKLMAHTVRVEWLQVSTCYHIWNFRNEYVAIAF